MAYKKLVIAGVLSIGMIFGGSLSIFAQSANYTVRSGDTFYLISQRSGVPVTDLMKANNATASTVLYPGNVIVIPSAVSNTVHTVAAGDTYWTISQKYGVNFTELLKANNATNSSWLNVGDKVTIPASPVPPTNQSQPYVTYTSYTVKAGDTLWSIANNAGIQMSELLKVNNMTESTWLTIGQIIKIPVHHVPVKPVPGDKYGEYLDWWTEAQYVAPVQSVFEIVDFYTGKSFTVKRTTGSGHADVETLTAVDSRKMKEIWGGNYTWDRRPVLVKINGRKIAASMSSLPHAGNESAPGGINVSWRSDNYGPGYNLDWVKNNDINGVVDLHFANSVRHKDGLVDTAHQDNIKIAAGKK